jgi:UDP-N-acetylmuramoylalanine--D-glutamate ligase
MRGGFGGRSAPDQVRADELPPGLDLAGTRVLVLGLAITGREVARIVAERGASVLASDAGEVSADIPGVEVESGGHVRARDELDSFDFVFASPGISPLRGFLSDVIDRGVPVISELELGARLTSAPVVAVTGTNGKTTVCRLAERMGREAGLDVYACGNLETKFITAAVEHPDADAFVVEASSFSLFFCDTFHSRVAIVTNVAPDHLDWHGTFEHYRDAKAKIASRQARGELYLYPASQPELASFAPDDGPERLPFGAELPSDDQGSDLAFVDGDEIVVLRGTDELRAPGASHLTSRGPHFGADAAAAAAAMSVVGADTGAIGRAMQGFTFDSHRLEPVGERDGVRAIDDSVATNTHATLAALRTFDVPIVLIAGGRNKGIDLGPLASEARRLRSVVAIGEAAPDVARVFDGAVGMDNSPVFVGIASSMREAVAMSVERARTGDVILLSPACASHDMFTNYAQRGRAFRDACVEAGFR